MCTPGLPVTITNVECWGCGKMGHFKNKCPNPKKDEKTTKAAANAVVSDEEEGAWAAIEVAEADWFCVDDEVDEVGVKGESEEAVETAELGDTSGVALVALNSAAPEGLVELYDSGCSNHISPYRDRFENFKTIIP